MTSPLPPLLALPPELRASIYDHVFNLGVSIQHITLKLERQYPPRPHGLSGSYMTVSDVPAPLSRAGEVPWLQLMLTCKTVARELAWHMRSAHYLENDCNRTYTMSLEPDIRPESSSLVSVVWRQLPCPQRLARNLEVHVRGTTRTMMSAINLFMHCGLHMERARPLASHLSLERLAVYLHSEDNVIFPDQREGFDYVDEFARGATAPGSTKQVLERYHELGKLEGYFCTVSVLNSEGEMEHSFEVVQPFKPGYGWVKWGIE